MAETDTDPHTSEPVGSYIAQMGLRFESADGVTTGRLPVVPALCRATGLVRIGALTILADCVAGFDALSAFDMAWVGTSELAVHGPFRETAAGEIVATGRLLKRRRTGGVFEVTVHDGGTGPGGHDRPLATATTTLSLLGQQTGTKVGAAIAEHVGAHAAVSAVRSLDQLVRPERLVGGGLRLAITGNVRNSWQVLSGGIAALLAELAAESAAEAVLGGPWVVDGLGLHFLAPGRVGPIEARAEVVSAPGEGGPPVAHLRVRLTDAGAGGRQIVAASATARPLR
jgi:acyl-coenzyme A thioesterase PaaI-like protein